jgi:hypothetical protein
MHRKIEEDPRVNELRLNQLLQEAVNDFNKILKKNPDVLDKMGDFL